MIKYLLSNKFWIILIFLCYLFLYFLLAFISMPITEGYGGEINELTETAYTIFNCLFFATPLFLYLTNELSVIFFIYLFCNVLTTSVVTYLLVFSLIWVFNKIQNRQKSDS
jgi:hypothetical protein